MADAFHNPDQEKENTNIEESVKNILTNIGEDDILESVKKYWGTDTIVEDSFASERSYINALPENYKEKK